jgi:riboflavin kinase/FMN adenylyltransferase
MKAATHLLGRPHRVAGAVRAGEKRGRELGFPTANIDTDGAMLPPNGVYAAWATGEDGARRRAVVNIGVRPTFGQSDAPVVEAHILEFEGDLYGQGLTVELVDRIRAEAKFEGPAMLKRQITRDVLEAKRLLGG